MEPLSLLLSVLAFLPTAFCLREFESNSLNTCMTNSSFSATLFHVVFTPDNGTLQFDINGISQIAGNVTLEFEVIGYGYTIYKNTINPCSDDTLKGLCPMNQAPINLISNAQIPGSTVNQVPSRYNFTLAFASANHFQMPSTTFPISTARSRFG
jgi:hypothetical protein